MTTENKEESEALDTKITELSGVDNPTDEQRNELQEARETKRKNAEERITHLTSDRKLAEYKAEQAEERAKQAEERIRALEERPTQPEVGHDRVMYRGKEWFTDSSLQQQVTAGTMTDAEAIAHQQGRNKAEAVDEAVSEIKNDQAQSQQKTAKERDQQAILELHPEWSREHSGFDPNNPLYLKTLELGGKGIKTWIEAEKVAKQVLGMTGKAPDNSENLTMFSPSAPEGKTKEIKMSEDDEEIALRMYYQQGNIINPHTKRPYTQSEAIAKYKEAKSKREPLSSVRRR